MYKENISNIIIYSFILLFAGGLLLFPKETAEAVKSSLVLCGYTIIPSLFPFMFISKLLMKLQTQKNTVGIMKKVFTLNENLSSALTFGMIGGYPIGASIISDLYNEKKCTKQEAERALTFCNNCGPSFIIGVIGSGFYSSVKTGLFLYIIHICSALIIGIIFRFATPLEDYNKTQHIKIASSRNNIAKKITDAVLLSVNSVLNITAYIILFSVFICILKHYGVIKKISVLFSHIFSLDAFFIETFLSGTAEMTIGLSSINICTDYSTALIVSSFLIGWGGLSVHMQSLSCIADSDLKFMHYIFFKFIHGVIASILTYISLLTLNKF